MRDDFERFSCAHCNGEVWLFGDEPPETLCPHCGRLVMGLVELSASDQPEPDLSNAPTIDLAAFQPDREAIKSLATIAVQDARQLAFIPVEFRNGTLAVAVARDTPPEILVRIQFVLGSDVTFVVAEPSDIEAAIKRFYP